VGDVTGAATRVWAGVRVEQGDPALAGGGLGTGEGAQVGAAGLRVGTGTGVADNVPLGRVLATGIGDRPAPDRPVGEAEGATAAGVGVPVTGGAGAGVPVVSAPVPWAAGALALCDVPEAACPLAVTAPEQPQSASPATTPNAAPIVTRGILSFIRTCVLLDVIATMTNTGKYVVASKKLCRPCSNLSGAAPV
jgi:hypothetical protein